MKLFATALKSSPFEKNDTDLFELVKKLQLEYELKLAFNKHHDNLGRFSTADHSASGSGGYDTTRVSSYGVTGTKHRAMTAPKTSAGGKREGAIHRAATEEAKANVDAGRNSTIVRETHDALYQHRDHAHPESGAKVAQAVKLTRKVVVGRDKENRQDYAGKDGAVAAETAHHLLTGLKTGKSVTVFQSHALDKNADQKHRQITQNISNKAFKNIDALHASLESHGLGDAIVHKTEDGYRVTHSMNNGANAGNTNAGRKKQRQVMEFRRSMDAKHVATDHHAGVKTTYSTAKQHTELAKFAAANPNHAVTHAYQQHLAAHAA
jgi:hypothetical protein